MGMHYGYSVRSLTKAIFTQSFIGKIFFRGIVLNNELPFGKDATCELFKDEVTAKIMYGRDRRKKDWLAMLSTDTNLVDEDIVRICGKCLDIEVFFNVAKLGSICEKTAAAVFHTIMD